MDDDGSKQLNQEEFFNGIKETGLELSHEVIEFYFLILSTSYVLIWLMT